MANLSTTSPARSIRCGAPWTAWATRYQPPHQAAPQERATSPTLPQARSLRGGNTGTGRGVWSENWHDLAHRGDTWKADDVPRPTRRAHSMAGASVPNALVRVTWTVFQDQDGPPNRQSHWVDSSADAEGNSLTAHRRTGDCRFRRSPDVHGHRRSKSRLRRTVVWPLSRSFYRDRSRARNASDSVEGEPPASEPCGPPGGVANGAASILAVMLDGGRPQGRPRMHPCRPLRRAILTLSATGLLVFPPAVRAQDGLRYGLSFGGTGFIGVVGEWRSRDHGAELLLSTFTFRDLSISAAGKRYFGASSLRPSVGAGLWFVFGTAPEGTGTALVARFPLGGDWQAAGRHYATFELNVNRSIWVNRPEPTDDAPTTARLIPLPSVSYRYDPD